MSKVLVVLHVFYHDQVDYFIDKMSNINGCEWDLLISYSSYNEETEKKIRDFKSDAIFMEVENVGYDVWPFVKVIKQIDEDAYDYILKLHTKNFGKITNKINGMYLSEYRWRNLLVDSMLKSKLQFRKCLNYFSDPKVGLVCSYELYKGLSSSLLEDTIMLEKEAKRIGLKYDKGYFCSGTMFMARTKCLGKIKRSKLTPDMWSKHSRTHSAGTLAHVYERILCLMITAEGYKIERVVTHPFTSAFVFFQKHISKRLQFIFALNRKGPDRAKYLTLFGKDFRLSK